jgi:hypothetical protein
LAFTIVGEAQVSHPDILEDLQVLSRDRQHVSVQNPINHIRARRVSEGALIVVELAGIVLSAFLKKLIQTYSS